MKRKLEILSRLCFLFTGLWCLLFLVACNIQWVTEAEQIIAVITPAITAALGLLAALGARISAGDITIITKWANEVSNDLETVVKPLLDQYNTAEAAAKPGILASIQTALDTIQSNFAQILPALHITDPATQQKVQAVLAAISGEIASLINVIPVLQGKANISQFEAALKTMDAHHFKESFNQTMTTKTGDAEIDALTPQFVLE